VIELLKFRRVTDRKVTALFGPRKANRSSRRANRGPLFFPKTTRSGKNFRHVKKAVVVVSGADFKAPFKKIKKNLNAWVTSGAVYHEEAKHLTI